MKTESNRLKNIVWAVDAFEDVATLHEQAAQALHYFNSISPAIEIQPVFAASAGQPVVPPDLASPWSEESRIAIQEALHKTLSRFSIPSLKQPEILGDIDSSISRGVDALSEYALKVGADLILVNSHARSGLKRFFLGSFAETLLHRSRVPVMVVGPKNKIADKLEKIIFPTEFNDHSKETFREVASLAQQLSAKVLLLHIIPKPSGPFLDFDYANERHRLHGETVDYGKFRKYRIQHQTRRADAWAEWATHQGIPVEIKIDTESESIEDGILNLEKSFSGGQLIAMEAQSSAVRDAILGSTTQKVVRSANCPVWVFTSHYVEQRFVKKAA